MMNKSQILVLIAVTFIFSCTPRDKNSDTKPKTDSVATQTPINGISTDTIAIAHNSENSLNWYGTYEAVVPCADCPGIKTSLTLNKDKTFKLSEEYLERKSKNEDKGTFEWDATGSVITLKGKSAKYKYKVGENKIIQLDLSGHPMDGPNKDLYIFNKK